MIHLAEKRKSAFALTACWRHQLADGGCPPGKPSRAFLAELKRIDGGLELYWHPIRKRWILYRVTHRAAVPSEDRLVKEFELIGLRGEMRSPGWWLLDWLRQMDKTRGGSVDPQQANREYMRRLHEQECEEEDAKARQVQEMSSSFAADCAKFAFGRKSLHVNRT